VVRSPDGADASSEVDVVLVDPSLINPRTIRNFKRRLYDTFGLQSDRYEASADYELYLGIAEPGLDACRALIGHAATVCLLAHEFMGMPTALKALMAYGDRIATVFYAHEVSTARNLVEHSAGHDAQFYNVLAQSRVRNLNVADVYGDQSGYYRHALVERSHLCHGVFAVGDPVVDELRFLGESFRDASIDLVYNGIPAEKISYKDREISRGRLIDYGEALTGVRPDVVCTHVARPVISKAIWRDLLVLEHLNERLLSAGQTAVYYLLSTAVGARSAADVLQMESDYGWPLVHQPGWPEPVGPEGELYDSIAAFNKRSVAVKAVLVNTFGWDRASCGLRMPETMEMMDLRKGTDVEFGQSIYEPFGISQLEPLGFGAVCVVSSVCGCVGFLKRSGGEEEVGNVILADYSPLDMAVSIEALKTIGPDSWKLAEHARSKEVAADLYDRLPRTVSERRALLKSGFSAAERMSWQRVVADQFLPGLKQAVGHLS
jgi:hypothetical protein